MKDWKSRVPGFGVFPNLFVWGNEISCQRYNEYRVLINQLKENTLFLDVLKMLTEKASESLQQGYPEHLCPAETLKAIKDQAKKLEIVNTIWYCLVEKFHI